MSLRFMAMGVSIGVDGDEGLASSSSLAWRRGLSFQLARLPRKSREISIRKEECQQSIRRGGWTRNSKSSLRRRRRPARPAGGPAAAPAQIARLRRA